MAVSCTLQQPCYDLRRNDDNVPPLMKLFQRNITLTDSANLCITEHREQPNTMGSRSDIAG